jgi:hypothetical protein
LFLLPLQQNRTHFIIMYGTLLVVASSLASLAASASTNTNLQTVFPTATATTHLSAVKTIAAGQTFDGEMKQWDRNRKTQNAISEAHISEPNGKVLTPLTASTCSDQAEGGDADAVFLLMEGATLSNAIIGPNNGEGVHCLGKLPT